VDIIELDISETGAVERVKLVSPAMRMTDMMILSAAKTWVFARRAAAIVGKEAGPARRQGARRMV
jgi:hypothetical protein